jgi:hypothetical protein
MTETSDWKIIAGPAADMRRPDKIAQIISALTD